MSARRPGRQQPIPTYSCTARHHALTAALSASIVVGEFKELGASVAACGCFSEGGYFRGTEGLWNCLDWAVVAIFVVQCVIWSLLEHSWYPEDYELLLPSTRATGNTTVSQDDFIKSELITTAIFCTAE